MWYVWDDITEELFPGDVKTKENRYWWSWFENHLRENILHVCVNKHKCLFGLLPKKLHIEILQCLKADLSSDSFDWLIGLLITNSSCEIRCLKKYCFGQKITTITSLENADYSSVNYLKISFRLWIINLKKQSLPQALRYFSVLYLPDGSCSRKSLMKCSSLWM